MNTSRLLVVRDLCLDGRDGGRWQAALEAMDQVTANVSKNGRNRASRSDFEFGKENEAPAGRRHTLGVPSHSSAAKPTSSSRHSTGVVSNGSNVSFA